MKESEIWLILKQIIDHPEVASVQIDRDTAQVLCERALYVDKLDETVVELVETLRRHAAEFEELRDLWSNVRTPEEGGSA